MKLRIRYAAYSLLGSSIVLTLLLAYPDANRSRAKADASAPIASSTSRVGGIGDVPKETTFLPSSDGLKTWVVSHEWHNDRWNCAPVRGGTRAGGLKSDVPAGQVLAGYINSYDGGSGPLPCESNSKDIFQGTIWFDLSEIFSKPPFPFADEATLKFKKVGGSVAAYDGSRKPITRVCEDRLFVSNGDSIKGFPEGALVPEGDLLQAINECPPEGCSINVKDLVNNWITGKINRYGFVIAGEDEDWIDKLIPHDSSVCETRYGDFSLTVKYRYSGAEKKLPPVGKTPPGPGGSLEIRKNYALASNGGMAKASSKYSDNYPPSAAINGEVLGIHKGSDPATGSLWHSDSPTFPQWLEVDFSGGDKVISEIDLFTFQDKVDAPEPVYEGTTTFSPDKFGLTQFEVQYWHYKFGWTDIATFTAAKPNSFVWNRFKLDPNIQTTKIRVLTHASGDGYSRIVELQAWGK